MSGNIAILLCAFIFICIFLYYLIKIWPDLDILDLKKMDYETIKLLDNDLLNFKEKFEKYCINNKFESEMDKLYLIGFCRLLYIGNGYQAPFRTNVKQAIRDSA